MSMKRHNVERPSDTMLDVWLTAAPLHSGLPLRTLVNAISSSMPKLRQDAQQRRYEILLTIFANFAVHSQGSAIAIDLKRSQSNRYDRAALKGEFFSNTIGQLEALELIVIQPFQFKKRRTRISPSPKLLTLMTMHGVTNDCVSRLPDEEVIILTRLKSRRSIQLTSSSNVAGNDDSDGFANSYVNQDNTQIDYPYDQPAAHALRIPLQRFNTFILQSHIRVIGISNPAPPAPFKRIFASNGTIDFTLRGRMHSGQIGGWSQQMKRDQRHKIRINGEIVCDLDYSSMHIRLAYFHAKCAPPQGDLYMIEGLEPHRDAIKKITLAMLAKTGPLTKLPRGLRGSDDSNASIPRHISAKQIAAIINEYHAPIAHLFGCNLSHHFTFLESEILMEALQNLMAAEIPVLPMYDGLMVQVSKQNLAENIMRAAARKVLGVELPVERKAFPVPL